MSAKGELVFMIALLSSVLAASIKESGENLFKQAECRSACSLARDMQSNRSKTGVKVIRALSCYHCLNRRKGKQWRQERIKDRLFFIATISTTRHRRSIFLDPSQQKSSTALKPSDCVGGSDDKSVPEFSTPSKVDVAFGKYENTSYWYVNVSWTPIDDSSGHLYGTLLNIYLNPIGICAVLRMNQTFLNINISFYGYSYPDPIRLLIHGLPYRPRVMPMPMYYPRKPTSSTLSTLTGTTGIPTSTTLSKTTGIPTSTTLSKTTGIPTSSTLSKTTGIPTSSTLSKTTASDSDDLDSSSSFKRPATTTFGTSVSTTMNKKSSANHTIKYVSIATASGILVGLLLVLGVVYIRRSKGSRLSASSDFDYDAFIIYSSKDSDWVQNKLFQPLEEKHHLKCCIHYRDFDAGGVFLESMADSVYKSFKIIAVYSKNFQESKFCMHELQLATYRQVSQGDDCLVIIRIDETEFNKLPRTLQGRTVIDYFKTVERPFWMDRLRQFLQVPEDSDNQDAVTGQERNTNNRRDSRAGRRIKNTFVRLNSTSSNESAVSFV